jgi:hypothetical protein
MIVSARSGSIVPKLRALKLEEGDGQTTIVIIVIFAVAIIYRRESALMC